MPKQNYRTYVLSVCETNLSGINGIFGAFLTNSKSVHDNPYSGILIFMKTQIIGCRERQALCGIPPMKRSAAHAAGNGSQRTICWSITVKISSAGAASDGLIEANTLDSTFSNQKNIQILQPSKDRNLRSNRMTPPPFFFHKIRVK